jgi:hypothetical protein
MVVTTITAIGGFVAFFFYHRLIINRLEGTMFQMQAHLDYLEEVSDTVRYQIIDLEKMVIPRSQPKRITKKLGRPVNPNSVRQKKLKGSK